MRKMINLIFIIVIICLIVVILFLFAKNDFAKTDINFLSSEREYYKKRAEAAQSELDIAKRGIITRDQRIEQLKVHIAGLTARLKNHELIGHENSVEAIKSDITTEEFSRRPPEGYTNWYPCEPYTTITDKSSEQWRLQIVCRTDEDTSIRQYITGGKVYDCIAIGNMAQCEIGDAWEIVFRNGMIRRVICGDWTAPAADEAPPIPDERYPDDCDTGVIEFIVDYSLTSPDVKFSGTLGSLYIFGGNTPNGDIIKWNYLGKVWR